MDFHVFRRKESFQATMSKMLFKALKHSVTNTISKIKSRSASAGAGTGVGTDAGAGTGDGNKSLFTFVSIISLHVEFKKLSSILHRKK